MRLPAFLPVLVALCACSIMQYSTSADESVEYKIKAGCLLKFLQFVEWPADAFKDKEAPIVIGVLGDNPFGDLLEQTVKGRQVDGRKLVVKKFKDAQAAREAHALFIGMKGDSLATALKTLADAPTLTVGETDAFIKAGGMIQFAIRDEKVAFDINPDAGKKVNLKIGSQLLRLAKVVRTKDE